MRALIRVSERFCVTLALAVVLLLACGNVAIAELSRHSDPKDLRAYLVKLEEHIQKNPERAEAYADKAEIQSWLHDYNGALESINKAITLKPNEASFYYFRGSHVLKHLHKNRDECNDYDRAIDLGMSNAEVYLERAGARLLMGEFEKSLEDAQTSLKKNPTIPDTWYVKGSAEYHMAHYQEALESLNKTISLGSGLARSRPELRRTVAAWFGRRATIYEKLNMPTKAQADYEMSAGLQKEVSPEAEGRK